MAKWMVLWQIIKLQWGFWLSSYFTFVSRSEVLWLLLFIEMKARKRTTERPTTEQWVEKPYRTGRILDAKTQLTSTLSHITHCLQSSRRISWIPTGPTRSDPLICSHTFLLCPLATFNSLPLTACLDKLHRGSRSVDRLNTIQPPQAIHVRCLL